MLSEANKGPNVNISLAKSGTIVTGHEIVNNVFNDYFVDVTTDIRKPGSGEAGQAVSDRQCHCLCE